MVAPSVLAALGNCYAHTGNADKALSLILDAANSANNEAVTPFCLRDAAAMYEQQGKTEKAVELYERIKKEYPSCVLVLTGEIERQLNSAK
jgi:tetratricopeptide (TPR) repeat protein